MYLSLGFGMEKNSKYFQLHFFFVFGAVVSVWIWVGRRKNGFSSQM